MVFGVLDKGEALCIKQGMMSKLLIGRIRLIYEVEMSMSHKNATGRRMEIKRFAKPSTLLPIVIGLIIGAVLFRLGDMDNAPGLSLIGLVIAFFLIMWGIYNAGVIKKGLLVPIMLLSFGAGAIFVSVLFLIDGEFEDNPGMVLVGAALSLVLICAGTVMAQKRHGIKH